jgi:hypothetical protein
LLAVASGEITYRKHPDVPVQVRAASVDCPLAVTVFVERLKDAVTPVAAIKLPQPVFAVQPDGRVKVRLLVASNWVNAARSAQVTA